MNWKPSMKFAKLLGNGVIAQWGCQKSFGEEFISVCGMTESAGGLLFCDECQQVYEDAMGKRGELACVEVKDLLSAEDMIKLLSQLKDLHTPFLLIGEGPLVKASVILKDDRKFILLIGASEIEDHTCNLECHECKECDAFRESNGCLPHF